MVGSGSYMTCNSEPNHLRFGNGPFPQSLRQSAGFACATYSRYASAQSLDFLDLGKIARFQIGNRVLPNEFHCVDSA
jgi:hypothetical protein